MDKYHVPKWLQVAIAASGGLGLFLMAFLDSTFLPFPTINDLLLVDLCIQSPLRMPYYASMATLGSILGCLLLFFLARKGEEAAFHQKAGAQAPRIRAWMQRNGFEWLFRLYQEPRRLFKRYAVTNSIFLLLLCKEIIRVKIFRQKGNSFIFRKLGDK